MTAPTERLRLVADMAYPLSGTDPAGYDLLPAGCDTVLGYVGIQGYTPHIWRRAEVDTVRRSGRWWGAIVTVPQRALDAGDGGHAAAVMLAALPTFAYRVGDPVFLDIEHSAYVADPAGAESCALAWQKIMGEHGYPVAVPYLPLKADHGWVAWWTNKRPDTLPPRWAGQQYGGDADGSRWDLSVMRESLWSGNPTESEDDVKPYLVTYDGGKWLVAPDLSHKIHLPTATDFDSLHGSGQCVDTDFSDVLLAAVPTLGTPPAAS